MNKIYFSIVIIFFSIGLLPVSAQRTERIVILHTNDTHSQIEPAKPQNLGGYARRMALIDKTRNQETNVLLFDAGDYWQGTTFFNFFRGRAEIDGMNRMRYDAVALGNHEFDNGIDTAAAVLSGAKFPILDANYDLSATPLKNFVKPYIVLQRFGMRIGVFGLSPAPTGLILPENFNNAVFKEPIKTAIETSEFLKKKEKCDVIVCLSHIGWTNDENYAKVNVNANAAANDSVLAAASEYIDVIIGGHTHTMLADNTIILNKRGKPVIVAQVGRSGMYVGRIDLTLNKK